MEFSLAQIFILPKARWKDLESSRSAFLVLTLYILKNLILLPIWLAEFSGCTLVVLIHHGQQVSPLPYLVLSSLVAVEWKWFIILFFFKTFYHKKGSQGWRFPNKWLWPTAQCEPLITACIDLFDLPIFTRSTLRVFIISRFQSENIKKTICHRGHIRAAAVSEWSNIDWISVSSMILVFRVFSFSLSLTEQFSQKRGGT